MTTVADVRRDLELVRLADELGTTASRLDGLAAADADQLAHLRQQLAAGLERHHAPVFAGFAHASTLVPAALAARVTRRVIGPSLAGRMAGAMSGARAATIMGHLDTGFLADCCRTLSADAAAQLLPAIEDGAVAATTAELARRDDHATLGRFVDVVDDRRLRLVLDVLADPRHLLLAGAATDTGHALDRVIALLSPSRQAELVLAGPQHPHAAANILVRAAPASRALLLESVLHRDDAVLAGLLDDYAGAMRRSPALRAAASSLPRAELAAVSRRLDRSHELQGAVGRLRMAVLDIEETS